MSAIEITDRPNSEPSCMFIPSLLCVGVAYLDGIRNSKTQRASCLGYKPSFVAGMPAKHSKVNAVRVIKIRLENKPVFGARACPRDRVISTVNTQARHISVLYPAYGKHTVIQEVAWG
ncbi:hypothetical protein BaRGS_00000620 [Batillaria attramentaria]|uniref:Uncharacterized protein n=1 Tax=Batillaria attramentaria TaxID=370345 RepID=A0ABD0MB60_9CAEN